jgi:S-adenosylmethionine hydrolase
MLFCEWRSSTLGPLLSFFLDRFFTSFFFSEFLEAPDMVTPHREGRDPLRDAALRVSDNLIHLVMDYGPNDMAVSEILDRLSSTVPDTFRFNVTSVPSFNTVATGFIVAQLGLVPREDSWSGSRVLYVNTAPRKDRGDARVNNEGEGLLYGILDNGTEIVAVNSGHSLSLVRVRLVSLYETKIRKDGSQFRSRDNFPPLVGAVAQGADLTPFLGTQLDPIKVIPEMPSGLIGYIDSFGNLKTTWRTSDPVLSGYQPGQKVRVQVVGSTQSRTATVATGSFNIEEGELALAPGSSGYGDRFWELFQRGGSAAAALGATTPGLKIDIRPIR